jgi:DNA-binding response OmpR family regulator
MKQRILYVEDEQILGQLVKESLEKHGFDVLLVANGNDSFPLFKKYSPHLCLLDIMLPGTDGYQVAEQVRSIDKKVPIIFLTAKIQPSDLVAGFKAGCNDYIRKPFHMEELLLRIENWLYVKYGEQDTIQYNNHQIGAFIFDLQKQLLRYNEENIRLSHKESELLSILCNHKNTIVSRDYILQKVWGGHTIYNSRILDVYISRLRKYFMPDTHIEIITLRGIGYKFIYK